jgi:hypothetical protein
VRSVCSNVYVAVVLMVEMFGGEAVVVLMVEMVVVVRVRADHVDKGVVHVGVRQPGGQQQVEHVQVFSLAVVVSAGCTRPCTPLLDQGVDELVAVADERAQLAVRQSGQSVRLGAAPCEKINGCRRCGGELRPDLVDHLEQLSDDR